MKQFCSGAVDQSENTPIASPENPQSGRATGHRGILLQCGVARNYQIADVPGRI